MEMLVWLGIGVVALGMAGFSVYILKTSSYPYLTHFPFWDMTDTESDSEKLESEKLMAEISRWPEDALYELKGPGLTEKEDRGA